MKNFIFWLIAIFCLLANVISLLTLDKNFTYLRDAIIMVALIFAAFRIDPIRSAFISFISVSILLMCIQKGFPAEIFSKIRNYVAFPFVYFIVSSQFERLRLARFQISDDRKIVSTIFYVVCVGTFLEALFYMFVPGAQSMAWSQLRDLSEEKGVSVGLAGGIINNARMMSPLLSPVQGSFVAFLAMCLLPKANSKSIIFYLLHVLTLSKITLFSDILRRSLSQLSIRQLVISFIGTTLIVVSIMYLLTPEALEINIASAELHFRGAFDGLLVPFNSPWGLPLDQVGALSINSDTIIRPGFESFIGSYIASFGIIGIAALIACFSISKSNPSNGILITLFFMWVFSDNIASPHLYLPVIMCALAFTANDRFNGGFSNFTSVGNR